ncbi:MAG: family 2 glycosyl transferase [SAR324 cluster bacterium]|nr:family 2 glycosyl transferase [SAR324 cluster bacterium]
MSGIPNAYLQRHALYPPQIAEPPARGLGLVVTIPSLAEPRLLTTLDSLAACAAPRCAVEVLVGVNASECAPSDLLRRNARSLEEAARWIREHPAAPFRCHLLHFSGLPTRHAGVGLARKLVMDEAVVRLHAAGNGRGAIAGLDAVCRCAPDYLRALERYFGAHPAMEACSLYFEHDLDAAETPSLRRGIIHYELFLRYFKLALEFCGHPFAFHTLGSCMAVRADAYQRQGGMNRRKAGEDFYFLEKFMKLGGFGEIRDTTVYPAARQSRRVPFGTGRAMHEWLEREGRPEPVHHPGIFMDLRSFLARVDTLYGLPGRGLEDFLAELPAALGAYLREVAFPQRLAEIRANSASAESFRKRFFRWFDRFRVLKYVHFASGRHYAPMPLADAVTGLLAWQGLCDQNQAVDAGPEELLLHLRRMEREGERLPLQLA